MRRYHFAHSRMTTSKKKKEAEGGNDKDIEKMDPSYTANENVN